MRCSVCALWRVLERHLVHLTGLVPRAPDGPLFTLIARQFPYPAVGVVSRPCECRWNVAACCAARVGERNPGRKATRNFNRSVRPTSIAVVSQASSHHRPVGVSAAVKPTCSAACATEAR